MRQYLIIGGSNGIGKALVEELSQNDQHQVTASYHTTQPHTGKPNVHYFPLNVENIDVDTLPNFDRLDGLVYLPGTLNLKPFKRVDVSIIQKDFSINVLGAVQILQHYQAQLKGGSVVLVSSIAAQIGYNFHTSIALSKGAIEALTKTLAAEWAGSTRVNCVAPSLTQTGLTSHILSNEDKVQHYNAKNPSKRIGQAKDIADVIAFLLSDPSQYITGTIIPVDGGDGNIR